MKNIRKKREVTFKKYLFGLARQSVVLLLSGLPVIIIELLFLLGRILPDIESSPTYVLAVYPPMLEYIMLSLTLLLGGAMFIDYIVKNNS